jgi:hypothetical protein
MGKLETIDIIMGVLYLSAALFLAFTAYRLFLKRFKKNKLEALDKVTLETSHDNIFSTKTKFLIASPTAINVKVELLDKEENHLKTLVDTYLETEEQPFDFDPSEFESGKYYLYLTSDNSKILRGITIA